MWDRMIEKTINAEANTSLQQPSGTKKIDSRYLKNYRLSVKQYKDNTN